MESIVHDRQQEYYAAINASNDADESTEFILFMLSAIQASLIESLELSDTMSDAPGDKAALRRWEIARFLQTHGAITNADVRTLFAVSPATANRILSGLVAEGLLKKQRVAGVWSYQHT